MSSVATYRALIPSHAAVPDTVIDAWLAVAAAKHSASAFGAVYAYAMVFWAASAIDALVVVGQAGEIGGKVCGPVTVTPKKVAVAQQDSVYWSKYLDLRDSRAASAPTVVGPGMSEAWPAGWPSWP